MQHIDVINRIKELCHSRSWTYYKLAKESGITYSTLSTMLNKTTAPSIPTLFKICDGFGITLSEFFNENSDCAKLNDDEKTHLNEWNKLTQENKSHVALYIAFLQSLQEKNS